MPADEAKARGGATHEERDGAFWEAARRRHVAAVATAPDLSGWPPGLASLVVDFLPWARGVPLRLGACSHDDSQEAAPARRALHALDEGASPPRWVALAPLPGPTRFAPATMRRGDGALLVLDGEQDEEHDDDRDRAEGDGDGDGDNHGRGAEGGGEGEDGQGADENGEGEGEGEGTGKDGQDLGAEGDADEGDECLAAWAATVAPLCVYCPAAGGWTTHAAPLGVVRAPDVSCGRRAGAAVGAHAYVTGGMLRELGGAGRAASGPRSLASVERFPAWPGEAAAGAGAPPESRPPRPGAARTYHAALGLEADAPGDAGCGGRLFVFGGLGCASEGPCGAHEHHVLASAECLEVGRARWRACAPMPRARSHACAAGPLPDGCLLLIGGADAGGDIVEDVDVYAPQDDAWRAAPAWRLPRTASGARLWPTQAETARGGAALLVTADGVREQPPQPGDAAAGGAVGTRRLQGTGSWLLDLASGVWTQLPEPSLAAAAAT